MALVAVVSDQELAAARTGMLGLVGEDRITRIVAARPDAGVVAGFLARFGLCARVADALAEVGIGGVVATAP